MKHPKINTEVKHSKSKNAWNITGSNAGVKYKIARIPYFLMLDNEIISTRNKSEALEHALFISYCFNNPNRIKL